MNSESQTSPTPEVDDYPTFIGSDRAVEPAAVEVPAAEENKKVPVPVKLQPFELVMEVDGEHLRETTEASSAAVALSKMARKHIKRIPLKSEIYGWAKSKKRVYQHGIVRDYDDAKRVSFKNIRRQTYKLLDPRPEGLPAFFSQ
jgi:hypothetical protein